MPLILIGKVEAPNEVLPNVNFFIYWNTWFIKWPWTKLKLFTKINNIRFEKIIDSLWFIGKINFDYEDIIDCGKEYKIEVGYVG